ncbi:MAG: hypothetical protein ACLSUW_01225 [Akkermansia sp.]
MGRVTEYYRDANLVLFQSIGQPDLKVGRNWNPQTREHFCIPDYRRS